MSAALRQSKRFAVYGVPMDMLKTSLEQTTKPISIPYLMAHGGRPGQPPTEEELMRSARYTHAELPVRLARRVRQLYSLPFIVGTNPYIQDVARLYASSFASLVQRPPPETLQDNDSFARELRQLVSDHSDVAPTLARGFMECREYMDGVRVSNFLDAALHSRIGIRIIAEQHLALTDSRLPVEQGGSAPSPSSVGIIDTEMRPAHITEMSGEYVRALCEATFEMAPRLVLEGDVHSTVVGIPVHLEYVMTELLKNSFRATTETYIARHGRDGAAPLPPIVVTLAEGPSHITLRIRDEGGGIPPDNMSEIFSYAFTTADAQVNTNNDTQDIMDHAMQSGMGTLAGLGYGLPLSRLYLGYFGGSDLDIVSLWGHVRICTDRRDAIRLSGSRAISALPRYRFSARHRARVATRQRTAARSRAHVPPAATGADGAPGANPPLRCARAPAGARCSTCRTAAAPRRAVRRSVARARWPARGAR